MGFDILFLFVDQQGDEMAEEAWKKAPVLCRLKRSKTPLVSRVKPDKATALVEKCFDYKFTGENKVYPFEVPPEVLKMDVNIIQIVGPSGSGKSTILKAFEKAGWHFPRKKFNNTKAIISNFPDNNAEGMYALQAVGLSSMPVLVRPRNVLSTGEGFRADMALNLEDKVMIDEYTSVIDRKVAMTASKCIGKHIRAKGYKNVILCGCHKDIVEYLKPDILLDLESGKVYDLRGFRLGKALTSRSSKLAETRSGRSGTYSLRITI